MSDYDAIDYVPIIGDIYKYAKWDINRELAR